MSKKITKTVIFEFQKLADAIRQREGEKVVPLVATISEYHDIYSYNFLEKPAAKSSTSVAAAATVCRSCGCRKGPGTKAREDCTCQCHPKSK